MLPESVLKATENTILAEDVALEISRRHLPDLKVTSWLNEDEPMPYVLFRAAPYQAFLNVDHRFIDSFYVTAEAFTDGPDSDTDGPLILNAIADAFWRAALGHEEVLDGKGWLQVANMVDPPQRRADYANSQGPVQYADLPGGAARHIAIYQLQIKRAHVGPHIYDF